MNVLLFSGSLRKDSLNRKLVGVAREIVAKNSAHKTTVADLKALAFPVYDGDIEKSAFPATVNQLGQMIQSADALIISSPEYNGSIAGSLKNTIDWVSRLRPVPLEKKPILLMGASPGGFGTTRALGYAKVPFEKLGAYVHPEPFPLSKAHEAFKESGELVDSDTQLRLEKLIGNFLQFAQKLTAKD